MITLLTLLIVSPAYAASYELFRPIQLSESVGRDKSLLRLDRAVLERMLRADKGDPFTLFVPGGNVELRFEAKVTNPKLDLDCCSITLEGVRGEAVVKLSHALEVRDFTAKIDGVEYRYRATGSDNFEVLGKRAPISAPETLR